MSHCVALSNCSSFWGQSTVEKKEEERERESEEPGQLRESLRHVTLPRQRLAAASVRISRSWVKTPGVSDVRSVDRALLGDSDPGSSPVPAGAADSVRRFDRWVTLVVCKPLPRLMADICRGCTLLLDTWQDRAFRTCRCCSGLVVCFGGEENRRVTTQNSMVSTPNGSNVGGGNHKSEPFKESRTCLTMVLTLVGWLWLQTRNPGRTTWAIL